MFYLAVGNAAVEIHRCERAYVGVDDLRVLAYYRGAADTAVYDLGSFFYDDVTFYFRFLVHGASYFTFFCFKDKTVGFQHVFELTRVLPPTLDYMRVDRIFWLIMQTSEDLF